MNIQNQFEKLDVHPETLMNEMPLHLIMKGKKNAEILLDINRDEIDRFSRERNMPMFNLSMRQRQTLGHNLKIVTKAYRLAMN